MWITERSNTASGHVYRVHEDGKPVSFRRLFESMEHDAAFRKWYTETLVDAGMDAFFWEHPPMTTSTFDHPAEFALLESPSLATLAADPFPFESHFADQSGSDVVTFPNLGGDALLIVPAPRKQESAYPHLAEFLRSGPRGQIDLLWKTTARTIRERLAASPQWLSTSGLGVAWVHLRLDTVPKYYQHAPYKLAA